jgi:N-dimethylarginine dimethylaminohydrolase
MSIDAIFCRDASITTDHGAILCRMGKPARTREPELHRQFFESQNIPVLGQIEPPGTLEGGDVAWLGPKTLAVGHSYRSNVAGITQLKSLLSPFEIEVVIAELPHYKGPGDVFHLMSVLSPVAAKVAVVYSPLLPIGFRKLLLQMGYTLIEVPEGEFDTLGCNVLALSPDTCLMVTGNPQTERALKQKGFKVLTYKGEEISLKGGGGPTCLSRPLKRKL